MAVDAWPWPLTSWPWQCNQFIPNYSKCLYKFCIQILLPVYKQSSSQDFHDRRSVTLTFDPVTLKTYSASLPNVVSIGVSFASNPCTSSGTTEFAILPWPNLVTKLSAVLVWKNVNVWLQSTRSQNSSVPVKTATVCQHQSTIFCNNEI